MYGILEHNLMKTTYILAGAIILRISTFAAHNNGICL